MPQFSQTLSVISVVKLDIAFKEMDFLLASVLSAVESSVWDQTWIAESTIGKLDGARFSPILIAVKESLRVLGCRTWASIRVFCLVFLAIDSHQNFNWSSTAAL